MIRLVAVTASLAALLGYGAARAQDKKTQEVPKEVQQDQARLKEHLGEQANNGQIVPLAAEPLGKTFPDYRFYALRFHIYPVAMMLPKGMKPSNLFALPKEGKPQHLKDAPALEKFFQAHAPAAKSKESAAALAQSWLLLSPEFFQDGFYQLEVGKQPEVKKEGGRVVSVTGRAVVRQGGRGDLTATMNFDNTGKVGKVAEVRKVIPGPRPICQATKLLDADPIVRRMAEADLLFMGRAARAYLMEQRERADPELRRAIDRIWQRILEQER
jgi:hypothetical protein